MSVREVVDWNLGTKNLRIERDGPIAWCVIDRPNARNALTPSMYFGIKKAVRRVNADPDYRAMIITGTGDVFAPAATWAGATKRGMSRCPRGWATMPAFRHRARKPGADRRRGQRYLPGRRLLIAMLSDIAVVSERATFRVPELLRGIIDATYAAILPAHVGMAQARDLLLSARKIDAAEAYRIGLVSRICKHEDLEAEARKAVIEILQTAPECRAHVKRMLTTSTRRSTTRRCSPR